MTTKVTRETSSGQYVHIIDSSGIANTILWMFNIGLTLFGFAYTSPYWQAKSYKSGIMSSGLWHRCLCAEIGSDIPSTYLLVSQTCFISFVAVNTLLCDCISLCM